MAAVARPQETQDYPVAVLSRVRSLRELRSPTLLEALEVFGLQDDLVVAAARGALRAVERSDAQRYRRLEADAQNGMTSKHRTSRNLLHCSSPLPSCQMGIPEQKQLPLLALISIYRQRH